MFLLSLPVSLLAFLLSLLSLTTLLKFPQYLPSPLHYRHISPQDTPIPSLRLCISPNSLLLYLQPSHWHPQCILLPSGSLKSHLLMGVPLLMKIGRLLLRLSLENQFGNRSSFTLPPLLTMQVSRVPFGPDYKLHVRHLLKIGFSTTRTWKERASNDWRHCMPRTILPYQNRPLLLFYLP